MFIEIENYLNFDGQSLLNMDCYSFRRRELLSVNIVLKASKVSYIESVIKNDRYDRIGIRYSLENANIQKLESYLKIKFSSNEIEGAGESYKCSKISILDLTTDCRTIHAQDIHSANLLCAIVASKNNWFGGVAEKGICRKNSWF